ncbi:pyridoxal phosphate-dependent transferase [Russula brevipes]|nr:pyridoxal phosphate-dependent transferase [Russula brevipes]
MLSAYSAVNQGHCHPRIVATSVEQAQRLSLSSRAFYNSVFCAFAEVTKLFGYDMALPMNTGADAVETGIKLARKLACEKKVPEGRAIVLSAAGNFHRRTICVIRMSTDSESRDGSVHISRAWARPTASDIVRSKTSDGRSSCMASTLLRSSSSPIQGEAEIVVPPAGYFRQVRGLCSQHDVLLICDEIQTGLCRTGKLLCVEHEGIRPDVLLGKALSGGMYIRRARGQACSAFNRANTGAPTAGAPSPPLIIHQFCLLLKVLAKPTHVNIIRFSPPLVISEEDLQRAVETFQQAPTDLDQLEEIPGEVESEKGFRDEPTG